jgi:hypothetical protein
MQAAEGRKLARVGGGVGWSGLYSIHRRSAGEWELFSGHRLVGLVTLRNALPHAHANAEQRRLCFCRKWRRHWRKLM